MSFHLIAKRIDFDTGGQHVVLLNEDIALEHGINAGDHIIISKTGLPEIICVVDTSKEGIDKRHIGLYTEVYSKYWIKNNEDILISLFKQPPSVGYIRKKMKKYDLTYDEIKSIMSDIVADRLGVIEKAYFLSTIYNPGYTEQEVYYLTKAMAETGEVLHFDGIVADKHSIGGIAGKGITPLVISIVSSFGITMPNTSTRSITTPAGTTDILETITNISFDKHQIDELIKTANACMIWGGGLKIAPADDELIRIERPLGLESFDKFLISIIAKKVAMGVNYLLIDIPGGEEGKVTKPEDVALLKEKFVKLCSKFGIQVVVNERYPKGIDGNGVGPMLEMREVLYIFENHPAKSKELEETSVHMAGMLLEMTGKASWNSGEAMAKDALLNGKAFAKFKQIIQAQGGNPDVLSADLMPNAYQLTFSSVQEGTIESMSNKKIVELALALGCPLDKAAGIYFYKKVGDSVKKGESMFSLFSTSQDRMNMGINYVKTNQLFDIS